MRKIYCFNLISSLKITRSQIQAIDPYENFHYLSLEPLEGRPLLLPCCHSREGAGPLVVCLHEGEGVQELAPLRHVVHVLECRIIRMVQEVQVDHHGLGAQYNFTQMSMRYAL